MQLEGSSLPEQRTTDWGRRAAGYGTPVPLSRVSLSIAMPRAEFCLLECVRSFLLVSPDSQYTFQRGVVRSLDLSARKRSVSKNCARDCRIFDSAKEGRLCRHFRNWYEWDAKALATRRSRPR